MFYFPSMVETKIPTLTSSQMREVDRLMIEEYRIGLIQMMENAGRNLAWLSRSLFLNGNLKGKRVLVLAGSGGNGGGGLVAARWLHNWGVNVEVILTRPIETMRPVPANQLKTLYQLGLDIFHYKKGKSLPECDLILDAIIGYSINDAPKGIAADLILGANALTQERIPILSLDIPSGLEPTTGFVYNPCISAEATMTLALPKTGLLSDQAKHQVGNLYLADIGVVLTFPPKFTRII